MEKLLDRLISIIGEEARLFEKFLELLEYQQTALIESDADKINEVTADLQRIVANSQQLEQDRAAAVENIRNRNGAEADLNVAKICEMADGQRAIQLTNLRETILGLYARIEETRMRNGLLVEQSSEQIRHTLEVLGRVPAQKQAYGNLGRVRSDYNPIGINRRV